VAFTARSGPPLALPRTRFERIAADVDVVAAWTQVDLTTAADRYSLRVLPIGPIAAAVAAPSSNAGSRRPSNRVRMNQPGAPTHSGTHHSPGGST